MAGARYWTRRAMEWAVEGNDRLMVSWALFRRSQQAAADRDAAQVAGLAVAARREGSGLPGPMLAAILQQEAHAHALDGQELDCQQSARPGSLAGGGSRRSGGRFRLGMVPLSAPAYLEMQRGACWLTLGQPIRALTVLDVALRSLPPAYRRGPWCGVGLPGSRSRLEVQPAGAAGIGDAGVGDRAGLWCPAGAGA